MKRCPECRRDYYDDSLLYCLDDGSALLEGPATGSQTEPATAILPATPSDVLSESETKVLGEPTVERPAPILASRRNSIVAGVLGIMIVTALGVGSYWLYGRGDGKQIDSIAVIPFVNESGNPELEYLSDGMTETLIGSLSQIPDLKVKARSSVFRYKGRESDIKNIGAELGVASVLNGRLVQRGDDVTLFLSLVDANSEDQIWGKQYLRKISNIVTLQNEIARDVSESLKAHLTGADEQRLVKNYTADPKAFQLYLQGRFHAAKLILPETQKAISYFQKAIEIDPNYSLAHVALARAYTGLALASEMPPSETFLKSKTAAEKASEIDPKLPEANVANGVVAFWYDWNWVESESRYREALKLDPNSAEALWAYSHLLSNIGRHDEALPLARKSVEVEPLDLRHRALEAQFLLHAGKADEALGRLQEVFSLDPNFWMAHLFAAAVYIEKGMYREAVTAARRAKELSPTQTTSMAFEGYALARSGERGEAIAILNGLLTLSEQRFVPPYHVALVYNGLGETENALSWLEKGYRQRDPKMTFLKVDPKWNNLRSDSRYQEYLRKVGFPNEGS